MIIGEAVAQRIKSILKERTMSQYRLEKNSGIQHGTMQCILKGTNRDIELGTIMMIARGFDMSFIDFLNDEIFFSEELEIE